MRLVSLAALALVAAGPPARAVVNVVATTEDLADLDPGSGESREKLLSFYRAAYDPSRVIVVISGAVNSGEVLNEVVRLYNRPKATGAAAPTAAAPVHGQRGFRYGAVTRPGSAARILIGFRVAPASSPDYPALELLATLLGSGESSILASRIRDEKKIVLAGSARFRTDESAGYLELDLLSEPSDLDRCEIAVMTEIEVLKLTEPDEEDVARARAQLEREFWERQQTVTQKAQELARFEAFGDWDNKIKIPEKLQFIKNLC